MAQESLLQRTGSASAEKPFHYTYLKEFRTDQCKAFIQHKCNQHRPFTCFHWHFMNQRRRRPIKKRDGTFNYSPDAYCDLYDENTGICPNGDECPFLHRNAGDTERRYHLRYYKTSSCVYDTDSRGYCSKNGPHCAFAHGPHDLRTPVHDVRELQRTEEEEKLICPLGNLDRERGVLVDDPRWQESSFVLTYYKTEQCRRPPRLCRQGYACPFFHNNKDRRRSPKHFKYRSTPCPNVKLNDEWGDPGNCDQADSCCYCHTRTEQQFHPEIYKSTKCNDVQQTGYCPRGPFCAFAHDDKELSAPRDLTDEPLVALPSPPALMDPDPLLQVGSPYTKSLPQPIGRPERPSSSTSEGFQKAPGAEVKSRSLEDDGQSYIRKQIQTIEEDPALDEGEKTRRKQNLLRLSFGITGGESPEAPLQPHSLPSSVSDALEAMVGGGLDDLTLEDIDSTGLSDEPSADVVGAAGLLGQSPIAQSFLHSLQPHTQISAAYPYSTPLGPLSPYGHSGSMSHPRVSMVHVAGSKGPCSPGRHSGVFQAALAGSPSEHTELLSLREELKQTRMQLASWQESWKQVKHACDAWKKEAEDMSERARIEREVAGRRMEELESRIQEMEQVHSLKTDGPLKMIADGTDLNKLPFSHLEQLQKLLRTDLERIELTIHQRAATLCTLCKEYPRCVLTQPCQHCVLCEQCAERLDRDARCPHCKARITQRVTVIMPV